jgi:hypothetical protein
LFDLPCPKLGRPCQQLARGAERQFKCLHGVDTMNALVDLPRQTGDA